jgi:DNA (cytosine-5)-methyltransferase 1
MQTQTATESQQPFTRFSTAKLGANKNAPRVYLQGRYLLRANFLPSQTIEATFGRNRVTIRLADRGQRVVSSKQKKSGTVPVIDINALALRDAFGEAQTLQVKVTPGEIVLTPLQTEARRRELCRNGREGSVYSGAGFITAAAREAGYRPRFAIELDEARAAIYTENFPESVMFNMSVVDVPLDELRRRPVEVLNVTPVCGPFSQVRTQTRGRGRRDRKEVPEASPDGDLTMCAAVIIAALDPPPAVIVFEQVPAWLESGAGKMMKGYLQRLGYEVETRVFDGNDYGELQKRQRAVMVAHAGDGSFSWPEPNACTATLGDYLDAEEDAAGEYFTPESKPWVFEHSREQAERGNNFKTPLLTRHTTSVPAITARYFAGQGGNPLVCHPTEPGKFRWLTLAEARRLQGVPESFYLGEAKTVAGEAVGEGVNVRLFRRIIACATGRERESVAELPVIDLTSAEPGQLSLAF